MDGERYYTFVPDMEDLVDAKFFLGADRLDTQAKFN